MLIENFPFMSVLGGISIICGLIISFLLIKHSFNNKIVTTQMKILGIIIILGLSLISNQWILLILAMFIIAPLISEKGYLINVFQIFERIFNGKNKENGHIQPMSESQIFNEAEKKIVKYESEFQTIDTPNNLLEEHNADTLIEYEDLIYDKLERELFSNAYSIKRYQVLTEKNEKKNKFIGAVIEYSSNNLILVDIQPLFISSNEYDYVKDMWEKIKSLKKQVNKKYSIKGIIIVSSEDNISHDQYGDIRFIIYDISNENFRNYEEVSNWISKEK